MAYSGQTPFYRLPYMKANDYLTEVEEERRAKIIDNLLYVATYGASKAIIEDAEYTLIAGETAGTYTLSITTAGTEFVIMAIVNYRLAYREEPITVQLQSEKMNYIYLFAVEEGMDVDPSLCRIVLSETPIDDMRHLLLATVDCSVANPILDTDTDKQYLTNIAAHTMDATNPHGATLHQSILDVLTSLKVKGQEIYPYVYHTIESSTGSTPTIIQIEELTPLFVTAMAEETTVGTVACKIEGNTISVTNSGSLGKKIILKVEGTLR